MNILLLQSNKDTNSPIFSVPLLRARSPAYVPSPTLLIDNRSPCAFMGVLLFFSFSQIDAFQCFTELASTRRGWQLEMYRLCPRKNCRFPSNHWRSLIYLVVGGNLLAVGCVGTILALQGSRGLCGCWSFFCGCIVELLQELSCLFFTFCLLGKCCPHTHRPRQPQRFRASRFVGVAIGVIVPNMSKGSRTVGTPHSEPLLANNEIHPKVSLKWGQYRL